MPSCLEIVTDFAHHHAHSRYVYGVSCRVRAKSYPRKHDRFHSPRVIGSPVPLRYGREFDVGFAATGIDYLKS